MKKCPPPILPPPCACCPAIPRLPPPHTLSTRASCVVGWSPAHPAPSLACLPPLPPPPPPPNPLHQQGRCTAAACPYLHVNLPPTAPTCKRFLRGYCPAGVACPHKHYTLGMVRDEKTLDAGAVAAAAAAKAAAGTVAAPGGGPRKRAVGGRYFDASSSAAGDDPGGSSSDESGRSEGGGGGEEAPAAKRPCRAAAAAVAAAVAGAGPAAGEPLPRRTSDAWKPSFLLEDFVPLG